MRRIRVCFVVILASVLVFAQHASIVHALSHATGLETGQQDKQLPSDKSCGKCLVFAALDGAAVADSACDFGPDSQHSFVACETLAAPRLASVHYRSRAPPAHS